MLPNIGKQTLNDSNQLKAENVSKIGQEKCGSRNSKVVNFNLNSNQKYVELFRQNNYVQKCSLEFMSCTNGFSTTELQARVSGDLFLKERNFRSDLRQFYF